MVVIVFQSLIELFGMVAYLWALPGVDRQQARMIGLFM